MNKLVPVEVKVHPHVACQDTHELGIGDVCAAREKSADDAEWCWSDDDAETSGRSERYGVTINATECCGGGCSTLLSWEV